KEQNFIFHFLKQLILKKGPLFNPSSIFAPTIILDSEIETAVLKIAEEFKGQKEKFKDRETIKKESFQAGRPSENKTQVIEDNEILEGIFINNAGLVLLNPFLPSLFTQTGLLRDNHAFVSTEAQQKAAVLLYYMQSGEERY